MKKLMIAAAAAVVGVSVASAVDTEFVYDFSASLKTTTGAEGKDTKVTYTVNLGQDEDGNWWYDDDIFTDTTDGKFKDATIGTDVIEKALKAGNSKYPWKLNTSVVKTDADKAALADALGFNGEKTDYNVQKLYKGKMVWCETFKYKETIPAECYRKATSVKISGKVNVEEDCCADGAWEIVLPTTNETVTVYFINKFGAQTLDKADDVEGLFSFGDDFEDADGTNSGFALAGQGSWSEKAAKNDGVDVAGITKMSGNIVGFLPAPNCETCCADEAEALAFDCDGDDSYDLPTAAYGTWSIKVNKKESFKVD